MHEKSKITEAVYQAQNDVEKADELIRAYIPFIRSEASKFMSRACTEQDDENSIAMMGFYEAIIGYEGHRGSFLSYAALIIKSRLIDYSRRESRNNKHISIHTPESDDDNRTVLDSLPDENCAIEEFVNLDATRSEIEELAATMSDYGVSFSDIAENSPRQGRTLEACASAIRCAVENPELLDELIRTKKLPLAELVAGSGAERKTLERHRRYILAMLLIQTNGYEIIRGHLKHVLDAKKVVRV